MTVVILDQSLEVKLFRNFPCEVISSKVSIACSFLVNRMSEIQVPEKKKKHAYQWCLKTCSQDRAPLVFFLKSDTKTLLFFKRETNIQTSTYYMHQSYRVKIF